MTTPQAVLTGNASTHHTTTGFIKESIHVLPEILSFGCIAQGFVYKLPVTLVNKSDSPQIFKVKVISEEQYSKGQDGDPSELSGAHSYYRGKFNESQKTELNKVRVLYQGPKLASGMSATFNIEFIAEYPIHSHFMMTVHQSVEKDVIVRPVRAFVVGLEVFKCIRRTLLLQGMPVLRNGVTIDSLIGHQDEGASSVMTGPSVYSELLMDDDDVDELCDIPISGPVCWDPDNQCLKIMPELGQILVNKSDTLNNCKDAVDALREKCYADLELQGIYTQRVASRYIEVKQNVDRNNNQQDDNADDATETPASI